MSSLTSSPASTTLPSAWDVLPAGTPTATATKRELLAVSRALEDRALAGGARTVLATFQDRRHLTAASRASYARLARSGVSVHVFARGLVSDYAPSSDGLRHVALLAGDPLAQEWDVVALGPSPFALLARDLAPDVPVAGADLDRPFAWVRTSDRAVVQRAADALLSRVP